MNGPVFDAITRDMEEVYTRRGFVRLLGGAAAIGAMVAVGHAAPAVAKRNKKNRKRKKNGNQQIPQTCQVGTPVGAVSVPATGTTVNTPVLTQGQRYRLRASGFWNSNATHGQDAFADFEVATPTTFVTTFQGVRLGLSVDGGSADVWGSYTTSHVYEQVVVGQGRALALGMTDLVFTDNSGSVLVEVLCA
jgi:hypothetical protein